MTDLILVGNTHPTVIGSKQISDLVGKRHNDIKNSIDRLVARGVINAPKTTPKTSGIGRPITEYIFTGKPGKRDCYIVMAKVSPAHMGKIVEMWGLAETTLNEVLEALESFDVPDEIHGMYVYAIRERETGRIKLGISRDPVARVAQLQTGNSQRLELVAIKPALNGYASERSAHESASKLHIRGEWFHGQALEVLQ